MTRRMEHQDWQLDNKMESHRTDVVLVGAGPIGLELAVGLKSAGLNYVHLDAQQIGHTISWFPRQAHFFSSPERISICGVPLMTVDQSKATREEYLTYLLAVARQFDLSIQTYERVTDIKPIDQQASKGEEPSRLVVQTVRRDRRRQYVARHVVLAIGDMHRPRPLQHAPSKPVPGSELSHVSHYFVEPHAYANQRLLIVGGKNSAAEAALRCYRVGAKVTLCQRQQELSSSIKYWLRPELQSLVRSGEIQFYAGYVPVRIGPTEVQLAPVNTQLSPIDDPAQTTSVAADFVLLLIGYQMDTSLLQGAGVPLKGPEQAPAFNPTTMETDVPGLYVAGTAAAGTQLSFKLFIENSHVHVVRILRHLTGENPPHVNPLAYTRLEERPLTPES